MNRGGSESEHAREKETIRKDQWTVANVRCFYNPQERSVSQVKLQPELRSITLLTVDEVAAALGLHKDTVWHLRRLGKIPEPIRISTQTVRWRLIDIEEWILSKKNETDKTCAGKKFEQEEHYEHGTCEIQA